MNKQNRYDEAVGDFFHSKTFKTIMTIALVIGGIVFLCGCIFLLISGGLLSLLGSWVNG